MVAATNAHISSDVVTDLALINASPLLSSQPSQLVSHTDQRFPLDIGSQGASSIVFVFLREI